MDLIGFFAMFYDFLVLLVPLTIIAFIGSKLLSKLREKIEDKFKLGWMKSIFITNFSLIFIIIFLVFIYFIIIGAVSAQFRTPELEYDLIENLLFIGMGAIRIAITALILSLFLLFFELIHSLIVELLEKKEWSITVKEFVATLIVCFIFLILFLFLFSWAAFGLFIYVFYGGVSSGPLLMVL